MAEGFPKEIEIKFFLQVCRSCCYTTALFGLQVKDVDVDTKKWIQDTQLVQENVRPHEILEDLFFKKNLDIPF